MWNILVVILAQRKFMSKMPPDFNLDVSNCKNQLFFKKTFISKLSIFLEYSQKELIKIVAITWASKIYSMNGFFSPASKKTYFGWIPCSKISIICRIYLEFFNQNWWRNKLKEVLLYVIIKEINKWMYR